MTEKWSSETTIKFVRELRTHECLWNVKSKAYKNKQMRESAYQKIAEAMNIVGFNVPEVKTKIRNLKSTYFQEKKKIEKSKASDSGSENVYKPNIRWFDEMHTLLNNVDARRITDDNMESIQDSTQKPQDFDIRSSDQQNSDVSFAFTQELSTSESANLPDISTETINSNKGSNQFKNKNVSNRKGIFWAIGELKKLQEIINEDRPEPLENQFDCFGKSVAAQLKTLPYDQALIAQSRIQNILSDMAIENYKSCSTAGSVHRNVKQTVQK